MSVIKTYYYLTKPGIIYGNSITAAAGFFLASRGHINLLLLVTMLVGLACIIASACVFNNYIDRDIDKKMERTKNRAIASGRVSGKNALIYATILGFVGALILLQTNVLTLAIALFGEFFYLVMYGIYKRSSIHGTVVGSVSGAVPPVIGYVAVTNHFDAGALILFLILVLWQMPHFYAIAIYRLKDYKDASIPVLPVKQGIPTTKVHILVYIFTLIFAMALLHFYGYTSILYLIVVTLLGTIWFVMGLQGFKTKDNALWARKMFFFSLILLLALSLMLSIDALFPLS